jgi:septal ring factor EnvC (AmiA/AmiB activator)
MIDEKFLVAAVNIKKKYISLTSDINKYHDRAKKTIEKLDLTLKEIEKIQGKMKESAKNKKLDSNGVLNTMIKIVSEIEDEGKSLEKYIEPLNKEIEKLAVEEQELYRMICEKHSNLSEDQIVNSVKQRLEKESLS